MASVVKEVDGDVVRLVVKPPEGVSLSRALQYLKDVLGIEGELAGDSISIVVTVNRGELGDQVDRLVDELTNKIGSIDWTKVPNYRPQASELGKRSRAKKRRKSRRSRRKASSKRSRSRSSRANKGKESKES